MGLGTCNLKNRWYCIYYGTIYTCPRGRGVGHISSHLTKCIATQNKDDNTDLRQSKLHVGSSGIVNWKYSTKEAKEDLTKFIVQDEQSFNFYENKRFESCVQNYFNP